MRLIGRPRDSDHSPSHDPYFPPCITYMSVLHDMRKADQDCPLPTARRPQAQRPQARLPRACGVDWRRCWPWHRHLRHCPHRRCRGLLCLQLPAGPAGGAAPGIRWAHQPVLRIRRGHWSPRQAATLDMVLSRESPPRRRAVCPFCSLSLVDMLLFFQPSRPEFCEGPVHAFVSEGAV